VSILLIRVVQEFCPAIVSVAGVERGEVVLERIFDKTAAVDDLI
jgi:hypothetical protein